jgi:hypothetical protein
MKTPDGVCRSALFVDFDNVFISLSRQDVELAHRFASDPGRWVEWLQRSLPIPPDSWLSPARRILVRRCYLNPRSFGNWRPYFIRDAFETIDCPPLTRQGKTSADVHMVLDIVDVLSGSTPIDEFIILSADADFTPVLLKLRKYDRRSIVLAIGPSSSSYTAASDLVIDQEEFLEFLAPGEPEPTVDVERVAPPPPRPSSAPMQAPTQPEEIARTVRELVARSSNPVSLAALAAGVRSRHGNLSDWGGYGSFSALLDHLNLTGLSRTHTAPGYLYDPERHAAPSAEVSKVDSLASENAQLRDVAKRVSDLTDTPYLPPGTYAELFSILAQKINSDGYQMTRISKAVRDECYERKLSVSRQSVNFVLQGIAYSGHRFGKSTEVPQELAQAFRKNTLNLCARNMVSLTPEDEKLVSLWLVGPESNTTVDVAESQSMDAMQ